MKLFRGTRSIVSLYTGVPRYTGCGALVWPVVNKTEKCRLDVTDDVTQSEVSRQLKKVQKTCRVSCDLNAWKRAWWRFRFTQHRRELANG